jgi:hypothetical protein
MRPATTVFAHGGDLPGHLWDLRSQLASGGAQAPPDAIGLASALEELGHVCASAASGRFLRGKDPASLVDDLGRSLGSVGARTVSAAAPEFADFRSELNRVSPRLRSAEGARAVGLASHSLSASLRRSEAAVAAWRDVVAAFDDEDVSPGTCETLLRHLRELTELRGHLWEPQGLASRLQSVLGDDFAQMSGEPTTPIEDRLVRCEALIAAQPSVADCAVWFVFANADLTTSHRQIGPLLFVARDLVPDGFAPGRALQDIGPLPELAHWEDAESSLTQLPSEHVVLARVWLPSTYADQAPRKARIVLESLLDIANPASSWNLYEGDLVWSGGDHFWGSSFLDAAKWERDSPPVSPDFEGTDRALTDFKAEFVQRLADEDAAALEAVEDARWTIALGRAADASQRVALGTRALERTLGIARANDESWVDVTRRFLKAPWVRLMLANEMFDAALAATNGLPGRRTRNAAAYKEIHDLVLPEREPGRRIVNYSGLAKVQASYGHLWKPDSFSGRIVREACAALTDSHAALLAVGALEARFDRLLARTQRQRNALIHGTRPTHAVLDTIDGFVRTLNAYMAQESLRTAETGQSPLQQLERWRVQALMRRQRLEKEEDPVEVLFPDS